MNSSFTFDDTAAGTGRLPRSSEVLVTSSAGDKLAQRPNLAFGELADGADLRVSVHPTDARQRLLGIGSSFTESAAYVLAHLEPKQREAVMRRIYSADGANFSLARTPIGATDFSIEGRYSHADVPGDAGLRHFSIDADLDGFSRVDHAGIRDEAYDLLPMIREALDIKQGQDEGDLRIVASAWTAPAWMKDIEDWYRPGDAGTGGKLKPECAAVYADYLVRYLQAYRGAGIDIWGLTPVNEPLGNSGQWESMHFSAAEQNEFIKRRLGPKLHEAGLQDVELLMLDHGRTHLEHWADEIFGDAECARYVSGAAVHWYESTFRVYEDVFDRVHEKYPEFLIVHTEGCIDDLGKDAPPGVLDPEGYKESDWFDNDEFWWHANASDWAYSATWDGVVAEDHPLYTPVHRYARDIIVGLNHWVSGWIDWNVVLDRRGGPNHVGNYCGAPIMIDTRNGRVYYTPVFHVLEQLSRSIRPGDRAVRTETEDGGGDGFYACASVNEAGGLAVQVLNTGERRLDYCLQVAGRQAAASIDANALQTIRIDDFHRLL